MRVTTGMRLWAMAALGWALWGCSGGEEEPAKPQIFEAQAARRGIVAGRVLDVETGAPVAGADVAIESPEGLRHVRTEADGRFQDEVPTGRAKITVRSGTFLTRSQEIAVAGEALETAFKLLRKGPTLEVGRRGGRLSVGEAAVEVPQDAYQDGTQLSVTYASRARVAVVTPQPQWVDGDTPRRTVSQLTIESEGDVAPQAGVRVRLPVPTDTAMDAVAVYQVDEGGRRMRAIPPEMVQDGSAAFLVQGDGTYQVTVDTRKADGRQIGYLLVEGGDDGMAEGTVLGGGAEVNAGKRARAVVDPQGARIEVAPGGRLRLAPPVQESEGTDAGAAAGRRVAPYAGRVEMMEGGTARFLVGKAAADAVSAVKLMVQTRTASLAITGTVFTVRGCAKGGQAIDVLEVVEGTVVGTFQGETREVSQGRVATFCAACAVGAAPLCEGAADASTGPASAGQDAVATGGPGRDEPRRPDAGDAPTTPGRPEQDAQPEPAPATDGPAAREHDAFTTPPGTRPDGAATPPDAAVRPDAPGPLPAPPDAADPRDTEPARDARGAADVAQARLQIAPATKAFGAVPRGGAADHTFVIGNAGGAPSGLPSVAVSGTDFAITAHECTAPLPPSGACAVTVRVAPKAAGALSGTLVVAAAPGGMAVAALSATGTDTQAQLVAAPASQGFGSVLVGAASGVVTFTLTNAGTEATGVPMAAVTGDTPDQFAILDNGCAAALGAMKSCTVTAKFAPTKPGAAGATIVVGASPGGTVAVSLTGTGLSALGVTPTSHDFGKALVGTPASSRTPQTFAFKNLGDATLTIGAVQITGPHAESFGLQSDLCSGAQLPAGGTCAVGISFGPKASGSASAVLTATTAEGSSAAAALTGTGEVQPLLAVSPNPISIPAPAGTTVAMVDVTVTNGASIDTGQLSYAVSGSPFTIGSNPTAAAPCTPGTVLPAKGSCVLRIEYTPTTDGATGALTVTDTTGGTGTATAAITGGGRASPPDAAAGSTAPPDAAVGTTAPPDAGAP